MSDRLVPISAGTPQWDAWLKHYRGSKTEMRMLACQRKTRPFLVVAFLVVAQGPPETRRADRMRKAATAAPIEFGEHRTLADGEVDAVADHFEKIEERREEETAELKKHRKPVGERNARRAASPFRPRAPSRERRRACERANGRGPSSPLRAKGRLACDAQRYLRRQRRGPASIGPRVQGRNIAACGRSLPLRFPRRRHDDRGAHVISGRACAGHGLAAASKFHGSFLELPTPRGTRKR
jgi:hypothetical protein